jgi:hypothetical protein
LRYLDSAVEHAHRGAVSPAHLHVSASAIASGMGQHKDGLAHATAALAELAPQYEQFENGLSPAAVIAASASAGAVHVLSARGWFTYCAALYNAAVECEHLRQVDISVELFRRGAVSGRVLIEELKVRSLGGF